MGTVIEYMAAFVSIIKFVMLIIVMMAMVIK